MFRRSNTLTKPSPCSETKQPTEETPDVSPDEKKLKEVDELSGKGAEMLTEGKAVEIKTELGLISPLV